MIRAVTQTGQRPFSVKNTNAAQTRILSANGSISFPSGVTNPILRASQPSSQSLTAATTNKNSPVP